MENQKDKYWDLIVLVLWLRIQDDLISLCLIKKPNFDKCKLEGKSGGSLYTLKCKLIKLYSNVQTLYAWNDGMSLIN